MGVLTPNPPCLHLIEKFKNYRPIRTLELFAFGTSVSSHVSNPKLGPPQSPQNGSGRASVKFQKVIIFSVANLLGRHNYRQTENITKHDKQQTGLIAIIIIALNALHMPIAYLIIMWDMLLER